MAVAVVPLIVRNELFKEDSDNLYSLLCTYRNYKVIWDIVWTYTVGHAITYTVCTIISRTSTALEVRDYMTRTAFH